MTTLQDDYKARLAEAGDIKQEMPLLFQYASKYRRVRVLELGVGRGRSTSAFLAAAARTGGHVWSVDLYQPQVPARWQSCGYWTFWQGDSLDWLWPRGWRCDVLFIDTSHTFERTLAELRRFVPLVGPGGVVLCRGTRLPGEYLRAAAGCCPVADALDTYCPVADALDTYCAERERLVSPDSAVFTQTQAGITRVSPAVVRWRETGGCLGLGVIEAPDG